MNKKFKNIVIFLTIILLGICINIFGNETISQININKEPLAITSEQDIKDGIYIIKSAINDKYVLDVSAASKQDGANIQLWSNSSVNQQKFEIKSLGNGYYSIRSVHSGKAVDVSGGVAKNSTNVQQWGYAGVDAQKWQFKSAGNGQFYIVSKLGNLCLNVAYGSATNGANIEVYQNNNWASQKFKLELCDDGSNAITGTKTLEDGTYQIKSALNEKFVFDIAEASGANNANVQLWSNSSTANQKFEVKYLGDGYYSIMAKHSEKMLNLVSSGSSTGNDVKQYEKNSKDAQKWIIKDAGDGYYYIISKINNLAINVQYGESKNGTNIEAYQLSNWKSQKFKFEKSDSNNNNSNTPITGTKTIEDGTYQIKSALNEKFVFDIASSSNANNANVQLWQNTSTANQRFKVKYIGDGYYTLMVQSSRKMLNLVSSGSSTGNNVKQYEANNSDAQKWIIKDAGNGYYYVISKINNLAINVEYGNAKNGANIEAYALSNWTSQKFKFEKINTTINIDTAKYPGYKEKVEELAEAHPDWNFEFLYTGIKFSDAIVGEAKVHSRNLVETNYVGEWICSVCGTKLYDSGWYCASEKAIAYYLDPRNFLDEVNIFQFQDVNNYLEEACTLEGIKQKVSGSFLQNYAEDVNNACKNTNVNPYYIIARLFQEQGIKGTTIGKGMDGGDGKTYYNPFNIGASGNGSTEIYNNALARAKKEGWDTMEKAIEGGIHFCKVNWLENYQNTLYQNRFDIDTRNGSNLYEHQYMQNLLGAYSEARTLQNMYKNTSKLESKFTFIIPVYEGMEKELSPLPSNTSELYPINVETTGTNINLRQEPNTDSTILKKITEKGTILLSIERGINANWQKVITTDGTIGYISGTYLKQIDDVTTCNYKAKVKTNDGNGCNVRVGPGTSTPKLTALADGVEVTVIDNSTYKNINGFDWYRIVLADGRQAFMPGNYLK